MDTLDAAQRPIASIKVDVTEPPDEFRRPVFDEILYRVRLVAYDHPWEYKLVAFAAQVQTTKSCKRD